MGKNKAKPVLLALTSVVIIGLILIGGSFVPFNSINQENYLESNEKTIEPIVTKIISFETKIEPKQETIIPKNSLAKETTSTFEANSFTNRAYAILSTQLTVTYTQWPGTLQTDSPNIRNLAIDSSSNVYWAETLRDRVARLNPATNTITEWSVPPKSGASSSATPNHITIDGLDKVWWQERDDADIVRLDPTTNLFTEWNIGTPSTDIAIDSSGKVWFSQFTASKLNRLDPATNQVTSWTIATTFAGPKHIAIDASDNVWFMRDSPDRIGRLVPSTNVITQWDMPTANSFQGTNNLAIDSSGNVFFGEDRGNNVISKVAGFNPNTNQLTEWDLPTSDNRPLGVAIDSTDTVYFAIFSGTLKDRIVRLVPSTNVITEFTLPGIQNAFIVTPTEPSIDSSDNVWFPEFSFGKIARLS